MAMVATEESSCSNINGHMHKQLTRSLERILEEAQLSGELKLSGRKLKDFPKSSKSLTSAKYNLQDTVLADLSKNRFSELPEEVTEFQFLEKLFLYHNAIRVIPESVSMLQSLSYLDLSRNQLTTLPREICRLPLQTLLVAYNRLEALPEELGRMSILAELDAGCNEITSLPSRMGDLPRLKCLDLRSNFLVHIPIELTYLKLIKLDVSGNRISVLPNELRKMKSLVDLKLSDNPLTSPPAALCIRGRTHVFKYLERQAAKHERARNGRTKEGGLETRSHATLDTRLHRRHNIGTGYSTTDCVDKRWSQEFNLAHDGEVRGSRLKECSPLYITLPAEVGFNSSYSGTSTPSTISPSESTSLEDELGKGVILHEQLGKKSLHQNILDDGEELQKSTCTAQRTSIASSGSSRNSISGSTPMNSPAQPVRSIQKINKSSLVNGDGKQSLSHIQTYREYKEALRQQRFTEGPSVYRPKEQVTPPGNESLAEGMTLLSNNTSLGKQIFSEDNANKRPVQKVTPSRINHQNMALLIGNNQENSKTDTRNGKMYKKPSSPIKTSSSILPETSSPYHMPGLMKTAGGHMQGNDRSANLNGTSPNSPTSVTWDANLPEQYSFTMRREFERAKEEADLIEQLRSHIETRLKMSLPEDLSSALTDGVVLCHLANHVKPRSVASIHVPSAAVPKLTMARCRRNVDNFLEACRKIGVDEEVLLDADAIMDVGYMDAYGLEVLSRLVSILCTEENSQASEAVSNNTHPDRLLSALLFITFIFTLIMLYFNPLPA